MTGKKLTTEAGRLLVTCANKGTANNPLGVETLLLECCDTLEDNGWEGFFDALSAGIDAGGQEGKFKKNLREVVIDPMINHDPSLRALANFLKKTPNVQFLRLIFEEDKRYSANTKKYQKGYYHPKAWSVVDKVNNEVRRIAYPEKIPDLELIHPWNATVDKVVNRRLKKI